MSAAGSVIYRGGGDKRLSIETENIAVARRAFRLLQEVFDVQGELVTLRRARLGGRSAYRVEVRGGEVRLCGDAAIEQGSLNITGGSISIVASDDGINAADGSGQSGMGGRPGAFGVSSGCAICISGGVITVDAGGDGIDSNGDIAVSGGELYISGSTGSGDSAIDCDGSAVITGGTVVAAGSGGMAQNFGADSTQGCILLSYPSAASGPITLQDEAGRTLVSYTPGKGYNCVVISCPAITQGSTYTVTACGQSTSVTMSSLIYGSGGMGGVPGGRGDMNVPGGKGGMGGPAGRP